MHIPGNVSLFEGIVPADVEKLLSCMAYRQLSVKKGEFAVRPGDEITSVGIVLSGMVQIIRFDREGKRIIQASLGRGAVFGESLVCAGIAKSPVGVVASEDAEIILLPYRKLIAPCEKACSFHNRLIENLIRLIARKNLMLNSKIEITARRTTREKVLAYLGEERAKAGKDSFEIPFSRGELADFLCVDRSALSRELSRMQEEGIFRYERNIFYMS